MSKTFGEILKEARKKQKLTGGEISKILGITQSTYSKYETNQMKLISIDLVKRICLCLKIQPNELFFGSNEEMEKIQVSLDREQYKITAKKELIERFIFCINETKKLEDSELDEEISKMRLKNSKNHFEIYYSDIPVVYRINKNDYNNYWGLYSIIFSVTSKMLKKIDEVAIKYGGFYKELTNVYVLYHNLLIDILNK